MRTWAVLWFLAFFVWLPVEDTHIGFVAGLSLTATGWLARRWWPLNTGKGALLGLCAPLLCLFLMAFKGGAHGHGFPDFTLSQMLWVVYASPLSLLLGLLLGWRLSQLKGQPFVGERPKSH